MHPDTARKNLEQLRFPSAVLRGLRRRCPICGQGRIFRTWFRMHTDCNVCKYNLERPPGYFLGSTYINYGITALTCTASFVVLRFGYGWPRETLLTILLPFCVIFPIVFFPFARSLWLSLDCWFDRAGAAESLSTSEPSKADPTKTFGSAK